MSQYRDIIRSQPWESEELIMKNFNVLIRFAFLIIGLFLFFTLNGCTLKESNNENQIVIAKITSRHVGDELVKNYPDIAKAVGKICQDIISQENPELINKIIKILNDDQINDPLLRADIQDIISLFNAEIEKTQIAQAIAEGLLSGILQE